MYKNVVAKNAAVVHNVNVPCHQNISCVPEVCCATTENVKHSDHGGCQVFMVVISLFLSTWKNVAL